MRFLPLVLTLASLVAAQPADLVADLESALKVGVAIKSGPKISPKLWNAIDLRVRRGLIGSGASDFDEKVMRLLGGWGETGVISSDDLGKIAPVDLGRPGSAIRTKAEAASVRFVVLLSKVRPGLTETRKVPYSTAEGKIRIKWQGVEASCQVALIDVTAGDRPLITWTEEIADTAPRLTLISKKERAARKVVATKRSALERIVALAVASGIREALARRFWARRHEIEKAARELPPAQAARLAFAALPLQLPRFSRDIRHPRPDMAILRGLLVRGSEIALDSPPDVKRWKTCPWCKRSERLCRGAAFCPTRRLLYMIAAFDYSAGRGREIKAENLDDPKAVRDWFETTSSSIGKFAANRARAAEVRLDPTDETLASLYGPQVVLVTEERPELGLAEDADRARLVEQRLVVLKPRAKELKRLRLKGKPPFATLLDTWTPEPSDKERRRKAPPRAPKVLARLAGEAVTPLALEELLIRAHHLAVEERLRDQGFSWK